VTSRTWAGWALSVVVAAALLASVLRGIEPTQIFDTARRAAPGPLALFLAIFAVGIAARTLRFWILLGRTVPIRTVLGITLVRNLLVDLLPARLGELSYVYLVTTRGRRPAEEGVATMALAFLLDLVALGPLVLAALLVVGGDGRVPGWMAWTIGGALAVAGSGAVLAAGPVAGALGDRLVAWRGTKASAIAARLRRLGESFDNARRERRLGPALALSFVVRACKYGSAYCLVLSLLIPLGYSAAELGILKIFLGSVAAEVAASLPIHGLAGFGTYEAAWSLALGELGYPREHAAISGLLAHAITQGLEYVCGGAALLWLYSRRDTR
jgi:uncharacterized membrane protein YbhN (UPF0104 family)